jgi:mono/diheme cytochrome c family protein
MPIAKLKALHAAALAGAVLVAAIAAACASSGSGSNYEVGSDAAVGSGSSGGASSGACLGLCLAGDAKASNAPASLYFTPPLATVIVDGTGPQTAKFTLVATDAAGHTTNVTADSVDFDRPDLATVSAMEPVVATAPSQTVLYAGTGKIHAIYHGKEATASLTVQVHLTDYGQGLSATSPEVVALNQNVAVMNDPATGITPLLYPYDKTVWPLGLTSPLLMWNAPQTGDVYHLSYREKNYTFDGYYTLSSLPGQMRLDQGVWDRMTASNDTHNGPDTLKFEIDRYDSKTSTAYFTSAQSWTIAPESLQGAIYYWTASQVGSVRTGHISRFQPGTGATPQALNGGTCMGCHAVNAKGTVLVADVDDNINDGTPDAGHTTPSVAPYDNWSGTRPWAAFDITQSSAPLTYQSNKFGGNVALTPDGTLLVFGGPASPPGSKYLSLGVVATGAVIANSGLDSVTLGTGEQNLEMPAFSPDGTMLAVVESANGGDRDNVIPAAPETIAYLTFHQNGATGTFDPTLHAVVDGTSSTFADAGAGLGYPSFTPDSTALAFHAGHTSTGCSGACDDTVTDDGNLFVATLGLSADAGSGVVVGDGGGSPGAPIRLAAACDPPNAADDNASVEPTFNPVQRGGYSWAVFTSMRQWGNKPWPSSVTQTGHVNGKRRLWVSAVDTTIGTTDPSHPAIFLEGQEDTPNMRGFWTLSSCIPTAGSHPASDAGTGSGASEGGASDGGAGACTNGFQCCSGFCKNGMCVDVNKVACSGVGGPCATTADCCNSAAVTCTNGSCTPVTM